VPACVNPDHLFLGTPSDNMADRDAKGRQARGEDFGRKLTEGDVSAIRAATGTLEEIGARFGISFQTVSDIKRRITWRHLA
ncbi:MAG TPA: hypothetical protein VH184_13880, partial [Dongiaceae bacterium]|nr:hypothetical protein [Dongiaceae bacterium]